MQVTMIENLNATNYMAQTAQSDCVVVFSASWCPDCRFIEPMIDALSTELAGKVRFYKVSFDTELDLKDMLQIRRIPTLLFYKGGVEVGERVIEPRSLEMIKGAIESALGV